MDLLISEQQLQAVRTGGQSPDAPRATRTKLGEELPIFCERCGYSLHGLTQVRCSHCTILQFHCPECGHHQPINTLRPAVQATLGRVRAWTLGLLVLFRIAYFIFLLIAWAAVGNEFAYQWNYSNTSTGGYNSQITLGELQPEMVVAFSVFGFGFGCVSRMFLLRWRRGSVVGVFLVTLVALAICFGAWLEYATSREPRPWPIVGDFIYGTAIAAFAVFIGAVVAWTIWSGLVKVFLPKRASEPLLAWQRSLSAPPSETSGSDRPASELAREPFPATQPRPTPGPVAAASDGA